MTERSETERAELVEELEHLIPRYPSDQSIIDAAASALRSLAAQDQKPVAWQWMFGTSWFTVSERDVTDPEGYARSQSEVVRAIYTSPPPAPGWGDAIEAAMSAVETLRINAASDLKDPRYQGQRGLDCCDALYDAHEALRTLRHNAPPDSGAEKSAPPASHNSSERDPSANCAPDHGGADAGGGVRVKPLEWSITPLGSSWLAHTPIGRYFIHHYPDANVYVSFLEGKSDSNTGGIATLQEAQAIAQKDYEQRVLSALSKPAPVAANASAEARLREALMHIQHMDVYTRPGEKPPHLLMKEIAEKALSQSVIEDDDCCGAVPPCDGCSPQHPHTSDCDKQGWLARDVEAATKRVDEWKASYRTDDVMGNPDGLCRCTWVCEKRDNCRDRARNTVGRR